MGGKVVALFKRHAILKCELWAWRLKSAATLVFAGHEGPVDAGDSDATAVGAIAEHDEAVSIGTEPRIIGCLWRG